MTIFGRRKRGGDKMGEETRDVPPEEAVERPWASNDKLTYDNTMSHCKALMGYSELAIKSAIEMQDKLNGSYATHVTNMNTEVKENNRFTLDRLYGVFPEEAVGISTMLKFVSQLLEMGWTPPAK